MDPTSQRVQLSVVAAGYAAALAIAAVLIYQRHMLYVRHPEDVAAAGGMYAAGDTMLGIFIVALLLVPTFLLMLVIRKSEGACTAYSKAVLGISLSAPAAGVLLSIPAINQSPMLLGELCLYRLLASPMLIAWLGASRWFARFERPRRLSTYALLIESLTLFVLVVLFIVAAKSGRS